MVGEVISSHCGKPLERTSPDPRPGYVVREHRWRCRVCGEVFKQKRRLSKARQEEIAASNALAEKYL